MNTTNDATKADKPQDKMTKSENGHGLLVFVRHTESAWNALGKWTGRTDVHITENGQKQAAALGAMIKDIELHHVYTSEQIRTVETLLHMLDTVGKKDHPFERSPHLNERDYGEYTGLNKWDVQEQVGEEMFVKIRRGWNHPIPGGETMKMVHERAVPFYQEHILPKLLAGKNVMIVSHGNTIRSLIKHLEDIGDEEIADVEMPFGEVLIYNITEDGKHHSKEKRRIDITPPHA